MSANIPEDLNKANVLELLTVPSSRGTVPANISQYWNNEKFKEYLDKAGALDLLTSALAKLYEEPDKQSDPLEYIKTSVGRDH